MEHTHPLIYNELFDDIVAPLLEVLLLIYVECM